MTVRTAKLPFAVMSQSLSPKCTPLKQAYDDCFNRWFAEYLDSPPSSSNQERMDYSQRQAQEFEKRCGKIWESYRSRVQVYTFTSHWKIRGLLLTVIVIFSYSKRWRRKVLIHCFNKQGRTIHSSILHFHNQSNPKLHFCPFLKKGICSEKYGELFTIGGGEDSWQDSVCIPVIILFNITPSFLHELMTQVPNPRGFLCLERGSLHALFYY